MGPQIPHFFRQKQNVFAHQKLKVYKLQNLNFKGGKMVSFTIASGVLAIIIGLLILIWPKLIRVGLGLYLIIAGILQLVQ
jgi:uncharacterized membrane protein HdeD (DUF308 family)